LKFLEFEDEVKEVIAAACTSLGYGRVDVEVSLPPNPSYGDLSSALPLRLAKMSAEKPADVAVRLAAEASEKLSSTRYVASMTPHRGGYLNFTIAYPRFFVDSVAAVTKGDFGERPSTGKTYAIEHTNVNPNKALHVGHARNLVLGDSLARVMSYLGNRVQALNYIDDSGAQVADVIVGFRFLGITDVPPEGMKFDVYCGDKVYTRVNREYSTDPRLKEKQSLVLREIEKGSGEIADYARGIVKRILAEQLETCWRLGARYDLLNWESQLVHSGLWESIFERMKKAGIVRLESAGENKGCWVIPDPDTGEQKVVVRSDGTAVYVAKDIPYAAWKIGLTSDPFNYEVYAAEQPGKGGPLYSTSLEGGMSDVNFGGADVAISVIDAKQSYLQKIVSRVLERLNVGSSLRYVHRGYEVVALSRKTAAQLGFEIGSDYVHMSGRKGLYVNVDTILLALTEKATEETRRRNPDDSAQWVGDVAEAISVAALRYDLLKQDPDKIIVFDMEDSLKFEGDTGPYLLYTYARARRILEKTTGHPLLDAESALKMVRPQEKNLVKKLSMMDVSAITAGEYLSPKEMAKFAHELAVTFNDFYESVQVNREEDPSLRDARLALVDVTSRVLARSMELIGIPRRERI